MAEYLCNMRLTRHIAYHNTCNVDKVSRKGRWTDKVRS